MKVEPREEHRWLERLAGEWTWEAEAAGPSGEPSTDTGTESVRTLGGVWTLFEGRGTMPDGSPALTVMTLGFDPERGRFVGTFIGSMMTYLWVYEGELDAEGRVLTLDAEGPSFEDETKTARYKDRIEIRSDDERVLSSAYQREDGTWHHFMSSVYRRVK